VLPHSYQYKMVDALLAQEGGLLNVLSADNVWFQTITEYFVDMVDPGGQVIVRELIDAYLYALNSPGMKYFKTDLFAHLLVSSRKGKNSSEIVAQVCQHFGAFGIKLGQFLLATGILPENENKALRELEDSARAPTREEVYADLREIFGSENIPYKIRTVLGGASLKYVVLATKEDGSEVVLKILAKDALIHTPLEEKIMKRIAVYLVEKHGQKYSVFKTAVFAAAEAVRRELSFEDEVRRSNIARSHMYKNCGLDSVSFQLVKDRFVHQRLIEAEFAPGISIHDLNPDSKSLLSSAILRCELQNIFPSAKDAKIYFEPDRHFGNYRVTEERVTPIDFGQLHVMSVQQRDRIIDVFAVSGILSKIGEYDSYLSRAMMAPIIDRVVVKLAEILDIDFSSSKTSRSKLVRHLAEGFYMRSGENGVTSYYRLLSILEDDGFLDKLGEERIPFYDFPKGLLQIARFTKNLNPVDQTESVEERFTNFAIQRAESIAKELGLESLGLSDFFSYYIGR
jgi:hypothetical protein